MSMVISGVGAVTPLGGSPADLLAGLDAGRRAFTEIDLDGLPRSRSRWAARAEDPDVSAYLAASQARRLDRGSRFAVVAAGQALAAANLRDGAARRATGVVLGTSSAGSGPLSRFLAPLLLESPESAPPFEFPNTVANAPASHVSIELGLAGPNATLAQKQSVIAPALLFARLQLDDGRARLLLVGAVDEWSPFYQLGFDRLRSLRREPCGGGGILLSEGAAIVAVESEDAARRRGAPVLCRVLAVGVASCPAPVYRWRPDPAGLVASIRRALTTAGIASCEVGSVFLAANGVEAMERAEAEALDTVFPGHRLAATGVKGAIGESASSGAVSVAAAALCRRRSLLPPFAGGALRRWPDAVEILAAPSRLPPGATLVLTYGVGGTGGAVLLA